MMRILTGDECGVLKECQPLNKKEKTASLPSTASRTKGVVGLAWAADHATDDPASNDHSFASLHLDSTVVLWERSKKSKRNLGAYRSVKVIDGVFKDPDITGIHRPLSLGAVDDGRLVACNTFGQVSILKPFAEEGPIHRFSTISIPEQATKQPQPPLTAAALEGRQKRLALGGPDRDAALFDLDTAQQVFKCKNLPPDPQTLLAPLVWPTALALLGGGAGDRFAVGSAHGEVRLYDARAARRPVAHTPKGLLEHRVTALCGHVASAGGSAQEHDLFLGDAAGTVLRLDLRALGRGGCRTDPARFVGPAGSVRGLAVREDRLVATGLDRMLRVFDVGTMKEVECVYMKQRINCLLLGREEWEVDADDMPDGDIDQEDVVHDYVDSDQEDDDEDASEGESESESGDDDDHDDDEEGGNAFDKVENGDGYGMGGETSSNDDSSSHSEEESSGDGDSGATVDSDEPDDAVVQPSQARKRQKRQH